MDKTNRESTVETKSQSHFGQDNIVNETYTQKNYVVITESQKILGWKIAFKSSHQHFFSSPQIEVR